MSYAALGSSLLPFERPHTVPCRDSFSSNLLNAQSTHFCRNVCSSTKPGTAAILPPSTFCSSTYELLPPVLLGFLPLSISVHDAHMQHTRGVCQQNAAGVRGNAVGNIQLMRTRKLSQPLESRSRQHGRDVRVRGGCGRPGRAVRDPGELHGAGGAVQDPHPCPWCSALPAPAAAQPRTAMMGLPAPGKQAGLHGHSAAKHSCRVTPCTGASN